MPSDDLALLQTRDAPLRRVPGMQPEESAWPQSKSQILLTYFIDKC